MSVIDIPTPGAAVPDDIFVVPTYKLNDRVFSLGNPTQERLHRELASAFAKIEHP